MVDALGGVSVCTPVPINDPKTGLNLQPGTYPLNGVKALSYARTRATARSDLDRIDRQQQVISALLHQALSGGTLTNPARLVSFVDSTLGTLRVDDALRKDLLGLARQIKDVSTDDVAFATVPLADVDYKTPTGESAVLWDKDAARELFRRIAADEPLVKPSKPASPAASAPATASPSPAPSSTAGALTVPPSRISVKVLNGTTTPVSARGSGASCRGPASWSPRPPATPLRRTTTGRWSDTVPAARTRPGPWPPPCTGPRRARWTTSATGSRSSSAGGTRGSGRSPSTRPRRRRPPRPPRRPRDRPRPAPPGGQDGDGEHL